MSLETKDVVVEGLVPPALQDMTADQFIGRMSEMDSVMAEKLKTARAKNEVLRFVGTVDQAGQARVGLKSLPTDHSLAHVTGTDNIVQFKTKRYFHQPLVVKGPGAGPEVTAAGVFADLLRLSQYLGAMP